MGKAIIYVRVSTVDKQTNDRQIEELKIKAQKDGYDQKDIIIYQDKISGYIKGENRPALSELMNVIRAETELYTMIYIHEISRLGRNPDHVQQLLSEISELQIPIFIKSIEKYTIVDGKRDSFTNIIINILSEFAHQEAEYTKMRFKSGLISGARRGRVGGGKMYAYGFKNDNQMLVADEDESIIIKKVFDLYQQGTGSKQIANFLNNNNVPTRTNKALEGKTITYKKLGFEKKAKDVKWSDTQIISILSNPIYKGERRFTGERIPIGAIITTEQFDDCTNIRTTKVSRDYVVKYDYLLKDLLECGCCNRTYFAKYKPVPRGDKVYMCSSRLQLKGNCGNVGVNISYLESVVYDVLISTGALADRIKNKDTMIVAVQNEVEKSTNEILTIKKELLDKNKSEERISESYFRLKISQKMFDDNIEIIQNEIENLNKKKINHEKTITSSRKMLKKLETTTSTEKFFANLKNNRKDVIKIFKEYIHKIIITKMDDIYVVCDIFLSIDGVKFIHPIKIFLDQRVPRKKNIVMTYGVAIEMIDHHSFGYNSLLPHMKKGGIADLYNNHPTISFDKIFQKKFKIDGVNKYMVPHENVFSLPITFEKNSKPFN